MSSCSTVVSNADISTEFLKKIDQTTIPVFDNVRNVICVCGSEGACCTGLKHVHGRVNNLSQGTSCVVSILWVSTYQLVRANFTTTLGG